MKLRIFFLLLLIVTVACVNAQTDMQTSIMAGNQILTVSKTTDGNDMILLNITSWDAMMRGTKYCSNHLPALNEKQFCIEIADHKYGFCKTGIGFGCSVFDCPDVPCSLPNRVNNENRICAVTVRKIKGSIKMVFIDHVDWKSLQNNKNGIDY